MFKKNYLNLAAILTAVFFSSTAHAFENKQGTDQEQQPVIWSNAPDTNYIFAMTPFADVATAPAINDKAYIRTGVSEGPVGGWAPGSDHPEGRVGSVETGIHRGANQLGFGGWEYNNTNGYDTAAPLTSPPPPTVQKFYFHAERSFYQQDDKKITGFVRFGHSPGDIDSSGGAWSAGFVMKGLIASRPDGEFDFTYSAGNNSNNTAVIPASARFNTGTSLPQGGFEKRLQFVYRDKITDDITFEPGLTITSNANPYDPATTNGLLVGFRLTKKFH